MATFAPVSSELACRIVVDSEDSATVRLELTNLSQELLEIECPSHPLEHLNLIVLNANGEVVSRGKYGNLLIRARRESVPAQKIRPAETVTFTVSPFATVPADKLKPGGYSIQAEYEAKNLKAVSDPVQITV